MPPAVLLVIPVYNHANALPSVVAGALRFIPDVLVVDDGSNDAPNLSALAVPVVGHEHNKGKGAAILTAAREARRRGYTHILTMDADGQHDPADIPAFLQAVAETPHAVIVGARRFSGPHVPTSSKFGRAFSGFWMRVQTGYTVSDMQSGFRAYPLDVLACATTTESGYAFEVEVLVKVAWAGFAIREIPVRVYYPPPEERVSHFHKLKDNIRISLLNTRLTIRALIPVPFRRYALDMEGGISLLRPRQSLRLLLADHATPNLLARSAGVGMAVSCLPLPGLQSLLLLLCVGWLRLHRLAALVVIPLTWPPLVPGLGVLLGYRLRHGQWLTEFSVQTLGHEAGQRFVDWMVGSLVLAPVFGGIMALLMWVMARSVRDRMGVPIRKDMLPGLVTAPRAIPHHDEEPPR